MTFEQLKLYATGALAPGYRGLADFHGALLLFLAQNDKVELAKLAAALYEHGKPVPTKEVSVHGPDRKHPPRRK